LSTTYLRPSINRLGKHSLSSLVRKYFFLTSDSIAIFAHYFQHGITHFPVIDKSCFFRYSFEYKYKYDCVFIFKSVLQTTDFCKYIHMNYANIHKNIRDLVI
jgi:hypothetical protein